MSFDSQQADFNGEARCFTNANFVAFTYRSNYLQNFGPKINDCRVSILLSYPKSEYANTLRNTADQNERNRWIARNMMFAEMLKSHAASRQFLVFTRYSISQHRMCLSLYFDLSFSLFLWILLALNIFVNNFWITKRLWLCAHFRFVECISIWGSTLAYTCLYSLADISRCAKNHPKKETMRIEDECICVIKVTRMCKMLIWNLSHR